MKLCPACSSGIDAADWHCPACGHTPVQWGRWPAFAPELAAENPADAKYCTEAIFAAEPSHFWFRARRRLAAWAACSFFPAPGSVLEIGCGSGFILEGLQAALPDAELYASDLLGTFLEQTARRVPAAHLMQMDARQIPFRAEFDLVAAFDVLEHIDEDQLVLEQIGRALRPGGGLLLTVPQHPALWSAVDDYSRHRRRYTRRRLLLQMQQAGFTVLRMTSVFMFILPALVAARLRQRRLSADFDPTADLRVVEPWNRLFERLTRFEESLIQRGWSLPAGGSLLAAGVRR